jgi:ribosomal protein S18 acetylase RimI-like enzyme
MIIKKMIGIKMGNHETDINEIMRLERATWPEGTQASPNVFESRSRIFPEGMYGIRNGNGQLAGLSTSMIISWDERSPTFTWESVTDNGTIASHKQDGNALYVVSVGVHPEYQGKGIGSSLLDGQKSLAKLLGLDFIILGSRIPHYHKYGDRMKASEYVFSMRDDGQPLDPEIRFYQRNGFSVHRVVENYMTDDSESLNYGVIMFHPMKKM